MTPNALDTARQLVACSMFRWAPGMLARSGAESLRLHGAEEGVDLDARCAAEVDGMEFAAWCASVIAEAVKGRSWAGPQ